MYCIKFRTGLSNTQWKSEKAAQRTDVNLLEIHPTMDRDPKYIDNSYKSLSLKKEMTQIKNGQKT